MADRVTLDDGARIRREQFGGTRIYLHNDGIGVIVQTSHPDLKIRGDERSLARGWLRERGWDFMTDDEGSKMLAGQDRVGRLVFLLHEQGRELEGSWATAFMALNLASGVVRNGQRPSGRPVVSWNKLMRHRHLHAGR
ncbi:hypothetical protein [Jiangella endophytica]|uniref:hypothetical protein n=1 Tax=Jiangella endophytica TaxID=1623398 RepID=UPI000E34F7B4|nr:hypothetical protein [Jiangella endophytica]